MGKLYFLAFGFNVDDLEEIREFLVKEGILKGYESENRVAEVALRYLKKIIKEKQGV